MKPLSSLLLGLFFISAISLPLEAQISPDGTTNTTVTPIGNGIRIDRGSKVGDNLFHSFEELSIPNTSEAFFNNASDIVNIFSRVTGGKISNINGLIRANGDANLFLINPAGIVFGENAQLNLGGSFIASTADSIVFDNNFEFSTSNPQAPPLLTVSIPLGLQFGETAKSIINQSVVEDSFGFPAGLQVQPGKTLALIGGNVLLDGGSLFAPSGRIEIGSVAPKSFIDLTSIAEGWSFNYENASNFQDIRLSQAAFIDTSGESSGNILLQGRQIAITDGSGVLAFNEGVDAGGTIVVKASEFLEVSDFSGINSNSNTFSTGASGDILIETKQLIVRDRSFIDTADQRNGQAGNLTINAAESVEIDGSGGLSRLSTQTLGNIEAGNLTVTTQRLILRDGGQIISSTRRSGGNGGTIFVNADRSVEVSGRGIVETGEVVFSGLFTETRGETTFGNGGDININTDSLSIRDGGAISVAAVDGSTGRAGNLQINANSLFLDKGTINAETAQTGGEEGANINLEIADLLQLENESLISATASDAANGGNIDINANFVVAVPNQNSDIIARAQRGTGGNIDITTNGIFGFAERSSEPVNNTNDIDPSSEFGLDGTVDINELEVNPVEGLEKLPIEVIDVARLVAQNLCQQGRGSEFIVTGKGGIAPSPTQARDGEISEVDLVEPVSLGDKAARDDRLFAQREARANRTETAPEIIEAQGWILNDRGNLELVAYATDPQNSPQQPKNNKICNQTTKY